MTWPISMLRLSGGSGRETEESVAAETARNADAND